MSAQHVLNKMIRYYEMTGQIMKSEVFVALVATKFDTEDIISGISMFSRYLDSHRKDVG